MESMKNQGRCAGQPLVIRTPGKADRTAKLEIYY
jgi:hypothetical protein